ncbi:superoxide dismutase [Ordospora colligata]|uniref:Superoxide dismutase n=1 Tax=Ordospora colligata OC4 TaxID=1354746 RepID=A0A0B2UIS9_9MICR|nr:superoxide dismutase [Ordospora colligata OC4]KHN68875.1 superoxide dismutase [Ordospora colligata OC4]TBU13909.1 superoxide dismutase [Ordospora colligata]TBU14098.1 superoxide dismutase [Ordospora colligata]TBU17767.1 superoxide dismutase [Ordospora colligata]
MFTLPTLEYPYDALEPVIDQDTMRIHHTKHHQAYITNLQKVLANNDLEEAELMHYVKNSRGIKSVRTSIRKSIGNFAGGHYNHSLFWRMMCPPGTSKPISHALSEMIKKSFGSHESMIELFNENSASLFGSGWVWLCYRPEEDGLVVRKTYNQDTICMSNSRMIPILGLDVWEHAYYLKYRSSRIEYIKNWWNVVNWGFVNRLFEQTVLNDKRMIVESDGSIKFV